MKICFVTESLNEKHGYGRVSLDIIGGLAKIGVSGPICVHQNSPVPSSLQNRIFGKLINHPLSPLKNPAKLFNDWKMISEASKDCDAIHFLTESFLATTIFEYKKPYYVTAYGTWAIRPLQSNPISRFVFTRGYKNAKKIFPISRTTDAKLCHEGGFKNTKMIYLSIDEKYWLAEKNITKHNHSNAPIQALTVAAINPSKGLDISLRGIVELSKTNRIKYVIVGGKCNSKYQRVLEKIAKDNLYDGLTIKNNVPDDELRDIYQRSDIFILPSIEMKGDFEGFGLILLEAMSAGIPIIATKSGAIPEIISNNYNGILIPENDIQSIVNSINMLVTDQALRQKLINNGKKTLKRFSYSNMIETLYKEYCDQNET